MPSRRTHEGGDLFAVFVHAGAGYHSVQNEKLHLSAVNDAAKCAMSILRNGGSAVDAVEMAIRLLEDREITNSGFGSNLTIDGLVECDATMVDHLGRSGAVGAVSQVKNPIALARLVLEASSTPLSLQRVPPNLIVGNGGTEFAAEHGFPIMPHDFLVSKGARSRWRQWQHDMINAEVEAMGHNGPRANETIQLKDTTTAAGISPSIKHKPGIQNLSSGGAPSQTVASRPTLPLTLSAADIGSRTTRHEPDPLTTSKHAVPSLSYHEYAKVADKWDAGDTDYETGIDDDLSHLASRVKRQRVDGSESLSDTVVDSTSADTAPINLPIPDTFRERDDHVTDTVGAIAIDCYGRIAAGSSSGGIGMKHRGRCGPAALVGIGTAVIPIDPSDPDRTCVATITSGTGEHMATTSAAATAANRIYSCVRKDGVKLVSCDEDQALYSMIKNDFMGHPGVQNQPCVGAIGVLALKKTRDGVYFYFGHNTDSFALASQHSDERKPVCVMSRSKGKGAIAQGGRAANSSKNK